MSGRTLWSIIFGLVVVNCFTLGYFLSGGKEQMASHAVGETIATIGDKVITREEWMEELELRFGKETLRELINLTVVEELAKKYEITVSDKVVERELAVYKSMYRQDEKLSDEESWRKQIWYSILLEELLTKDVSVSENEIKDFYQENRDLFYQDELFHLAHIVVNSKDEANLLLEELGGGSSFEALAVEKSIDDYTANLGGDLGYVSKDKHHSVVPDSYFEVASLLKKGEWSEPINVDNKYVIIYLKGKIDKKEYSMDEVKGQIRRQIALQQMEGDVTAEKLWDDIGVTWFYGSSEEN